MRQFLRTYPLYKNAEREFITIDLREVAAVCDMGDYPAAKGASIVTLKSGRAFRVSIDREAVYKEWSRVLEHGR